MSTAICRRTRVRSGPVAGSISQRISKAEELNASAAESPGPLTVRGDVTAHTMPIRGTVRDGPFRPGRRFAPPSSRTSQPINAAVRLPGPGFRGDGDLTDQLYAWL